MSINRMDKLWYIHPAEHYTERGMNELAAHKVDEFQTQCYKKKKNEDTKYSMIPFI